MEDKLQCDGCKKDGSFNDDDSPLLYGQDWDNKIYCDDCIPKWWEEKIESEVDWVEKHQSCTDNQILYTY